MEYRDLPPTQIVPQLADEGTYLASESTFYRLLRAAKQMAHRLRAKPATSKKPREQMATGPNQVWSWDITYLPGPGRARPCWPRCSGWVWCLPSADPM